MSKAEEGHIFKLIKSIKGFEVSTVIVRDPDQISWDIDLDNKKIAIRTTLDSLIESLKTITEFLNDPENNEQWEDLKKNFSEWLEKRRREKEETPLLRDLRAMKEELERRKAEDDNKKE